MVNDSNNNSRGGLYGETDLRGFDDDGFSISDENNGETAESGGKNYKPIGDFLTTILSCLKRSLIVTAVRTVNEEPPTGKRLFHARSLKDVLRKKGKRKKAQNYIFFVRDMLCCACCFAYRMGNGRVFIAS